MGRAADSCRNDIAGGLRRHDYTMHFIFEVRRDDSASLRRPGLIHTYRRTGWAAVSRQGVNCICGRRQPAGNSLASRGLSLRKERLQRRYSRVLFAVGVVFASGIWWGTSCTVREVRGKPIKRLERVFR